MTVPEPLRDVVERSAPLGEQIVEPTVGEVADYLLVTLVEAGLDPRPGDTAKGSGSDLEVRVPEDPGSVGRTADHRLELPRVVTESLALLTTAGPEDERPARIDEDRLAVVRPDDDVRRVTNIPVGKEDVDVDTGAEPLTEILEAERVTMLAWDCLCREADNLAPAIVDKLDPPGYRDVGVEIEDPVREVLDERLQRRVRR